MSMPSLADTIIPKPRIPRATYRLQFNAHFTFRDALLLVPYLDALGISDCYASPILLARPGSMHGYDVCDPTRLNPELGTQADFDAFSEALRSRGMGLLLDTVPNHMGVYTEANPWWMDVLENGPSSRFAAYFDIDWQPLKAEIRNKILLPILGEHYGEALAHGAIQLAYDQGFFWLNIYDMRLPIAPRTYPHILRPHLQKLRQELSIDHEAVQELESIITALSHLPPTTVQDPEIIAIHNREKNVAHRRIAALYTSNAAARSTLDAVVQHVNGVSDDSASFDLLDHLIAHQSYRPAFWRVAAEEINYRRFFDINLLAAVQVEREEVFEATHRLFFQLLADGKATGLRIDHPDGLWDPAAYFRNLQDRFVTDQCARWLRDHEKEGIEQPEMRAQVAEVLANWRATLRSHHDETRDWPLYVVVEKILSEREPLPADWPVFGTTGYDFLNSVNDLLVARENESAFTQIYQEFIESKTPFKTIVNQSKRLTMNNSLTSEINALGHKLERITEHNRNYRDYTLNSVVAALREVILYLQVYRTYITDDLVVSKRDQEYVRAAVAEAQSRNNGLPEGIFSFIEDILLLNNLHLFREEDRRHVVDFVMKCQQVTGPIMAKSLEDTAFYIFNRFISFNEVGGNPEQFGGSVGRFHDGNTARAREWPHALLATSTHDAKRGEDVRARLDVLSEVPTEWAEAVKRWHTLLLPFKTLSTRGEMPSRDDEYAMYQTMIGIWPDHPPTPAEWSLLRQRLTDYLIKVAQESKINSNWINPNQEYIDAITAFITALSEGETAQAFRDDFTAFQQHVIYFGRFNGLTQLLLKLVAPGVPDFYQGTELWETVLVDPDNRRPIDYPIRRRYLAEIQAAIQRAEGRYHDLCHTLLANMADGRSKLYTIARGLDLRRRRDHLFAQGTYRQLEARGDHWQHICAFARQFGDEVVIAVAPRLLLKLTGGEERPPIGATTWRNTWLTLPDEFAGLQFRDCFTGQSIVVGEQDGVPCLSVASILNDFPIAILEPATP